MIHDHLDQLAVLQPHAEFAFHKHRRIDAGESARTANRLANALLLGGIRTGDRVAILSRNSIEYTLLFFAISKTGAVTVPLNFRLLPPEWSFILNDSTTKVLFAAPEFVSRIDAIRNELSGVTRFVTIGDAAREGWESWPDILFEQPDLAPVIDYGNDPDALQLYTSDTKGRPMGAVLTHAGLGAATSGTSSLWAAAPGERILLVMPLFHIFGVALVCLNAQWESCLYIQDDFHPIETVRILDEERIGVAPMVPSMIQACLISAAGANQRKFAALRMIAYGASPIAETTLRRAVETFRCGFVQAYGLTEFSPISVLTSDDHIRALREKPELLLSAGRVVPSVELKIVNLKGEGVPAGVTGEIVVRGIQCMRHYWNQPEATAATMRNSWMRTGDVGYLDQEGYLYIQDRVQDTIVSGGENIYPNEVEAVLTELSEVAEVAVVGVPHKLWGESIKAVIVLRPGTALSEKQVIAFCRTRVAGYKVPTSVDFAKTLPRTPTGKVSRRQLRETWWKGQQRRVGGA